MTWPAGRVATRARTARLDESVMRPRISISPVRSTCDAEPSALVAIGPRADVARGVEGVAAERARRPARRDQGGAPAGEGPGIRRCQGDPDRVAPERGHVVVGLL